MTFNSIIFFALAIIAGKCFSQNVTPVRFEISTGGSLSHTGVPVIISFEAQRKNISFYLGPKLSIWDTYLSKNDPFGFCAGLKYYFINPQEANKWNFYFVFDYQVVGYKAYSKNKLEADRGSFVHEYIGGYGLQLKISSRLFLSNVLGVGSYNEYLYNVDLKERFKYSGFNNLIKLLITYKFNK
jgi:hypothetical protein